MFGCALIFLGAVLSAESIKLEKGVVEIQSRKLMIPLVFDVTDPKPIKGVRLFYSTDRAKTWKHHKDHGADKDRVFFAAPKDGLYWFAIQVVGTDGTKEPPNRKGLKPGLMVYVNSEKRPIKSHRKLREMSSAELEHEVKQLRKTVKELKRRIAELEAERKGK